MLFPPGRENEGDILSIHDRRVIETFFSFGIPAKISNLGHRTSGNRGGLSSIEGIFYEYACISNSVPKCAKCCSHNDGNVKVDGHGLHSEAL